MRWIVLLIILFIIPYTFLTLRFRKPGPAYQPYQDARERERIGLLGYRRVTITAVRPTESRLAPGGAVVAAGGGMPEDLRSSLIVPPLLPAAIGGVFAPAAADGAERYSIEFVCLLSDDSQQLSGAQLYVKGPAVYIVPDFERLSGGLSARTRQNLISLTFPPEALPPGRYQVTLLGQTGSKQWTLQVH
jgi:hypothetical protein